MTEKRASDPLEGFHFDDFDEETKTLTIRIHKYILQHPAQKPALLAKLKDILDHDDSINKINVAPRN